MNIGFWACIVLVPIFLLLAAFFTVAKENGAKFISGYHSLTKAEQELYDWAWVVRDMRNSLLIWTAVMVLGAVISLLVTKYAAIVAYLIFIFLFLQDVHMDAYSAFEKYLKKK